MDPGINYKLTHRILYGMLVLFLLSCSSPVPAKPMKQLITLCIIPLLLFSNVFSDDIETISITPDKPFIEVSHNGKNIKIKRSQVDSKNIKTKPCPPFCIKPLKLGANIVTFAEVEVVSFLSNEVKNQTGILVDSRMAKYFEKETIPGATNIPFLLFNSSQVKEVLKLLGVTEENSTMDFSEAKSMCFFCDDSLCDEANRSISALLDLGYPASKLKYYRGGMQAWKSLNLTTISTDKQQADTTKTN